jgi:hypothetical protein
MPPPLGNGEKRNIARLRREGSLVRQSHDDSIERISSVIAKVIEPLNSALVAVHVSGVDTAPAPSIEVP